MTVIVLQELAEHAWPQHGFSLGLEVSPFDLWPQDAFRQFSDRNGACLRATVDQTEGDRSPGEKFELRPFRIDVQRFGDI